MTIMKRNKEKLILLLSFLLILFLATNVKADNLTDGAVSHWTFNESVGSTTFADSQGYNTLNILGGGAGYVSGIINRSFNVSGNSLATMNTVISSKPAYTTTDISLSLWYYGKDFGAGRGLVDGANSLCGNSFQFDTDGAGTSLRWITTGVVLTVPTTTLNTSTWNHIVVSRTNTNTSVYFNGIQIASAGASTYNPLTGSSCRPHIGGYNVSNGLVNSRIDEFTFYNRSINSSEVLAIYRNVSSGIPFPYIQSSSPTDPAITFTVNTTNNNVARYVTTPYVDIETVVTNFLNYSNTTIYLYYSNGSIRNITSSGLTTNMTKVNYTDLNPGVYYFNASATNGTTIYSSTRFFTIYNITQATFTAPLNDSLQYQFINFNWTNFSTTNNVYNATNYTITIKNGSVIRQFVMGLNNTFTFDAYYYNFSVGRYWAIVNATFNDNVTYTISPNIYFNITTNASINITAYDSYSGLQIQNFTVLLDGGQSATASPYNALLFANSSQEYGLNFTTPYLPKNVRLNVTNKYTNYNTTLTQTDILFVFRHAYTNEIINNVNISFRDLNNSKNFTTTNGLLNINPPSGQNITFRVNASRYNIINPTYVFPAGDQSTYDITLYPVLNVSIYDERLSLISLSYFNFSNPHSVVYSAYCEDGTVVTNLIPNTTGAAPYNLNLTCVTNYVKFQLQYNNLDGTTTIYHRTLLFPSTITDFNFDVFLPDLSTTTIVQTFLEPYDLLGIYTVERNTRVAITEQMPSGTELITSDYMQSTGTITAYLIQGNQYIITVYADDQPARVIGPYSADTSGTQVLRLFDIRIGTSNSTLVSQTSTYTATTLINTSNENQSVIRMSYYDPTQETALLALSVYNGSCDNIGGLLTNQSFSQSVLNSSDYTVLLSWNVFGSRYMNGSSNTNYCTKYYRVYSDLTTQETNITVNYDSFILQPGQFSSPWTLQWIIFLFLLVITLGLSARNVSWGLILVTGLALIFTSWHWFATGSTAAGVSSAVIIGIAFVISLAFLIKRTTL